VMPGRSFSVFNPQISQIIFRFVLSIE